MTVKKPSAKVIEQAVSDYSKEYMRLYIKRPDITITERGTVSVDGKPATTLTILRQLTRKMQSLGT